MKKTILITLSAATFMFSAFSNHAMDRFNLSSIDIPSLNPATKVGVASVTAGLTAYIAYKWYQHYVYHKAIDETVEALYLCMTLNTTIERLPEQEKEAAFRKKAQCINMRQRIITKLRTKLQDQDLSPKHKAILSEKVKKTSDIFAVIDTLRKPNPYEKEYLNASMLENLIENNFVNSVVLNLKPDNECSPKEIALKAELALKRSLIINKLENRIAKNIIDKALAVAICFHYLKNM